jgi:hypothetical protein
LEGTGSFAAGFVMVLAEAGEDVVEVGAVKRSRGMKNDCIDAVRARGLREALRQILVTRQAVLVSRTAIDELKSLAVVAPKHLRAVLRGRPLTTQLTRIEQLSTSAEASVEHRITVLTLRSIAVRVRFLFEQASQLDPELLALVKQHPAGPTMLSEPGVGPIVCRANCSSAGPTAAESAAKPRSPRSPASHPLRPAAVSESDTDSAAPETATSTEHFTRSRSPDCAAMPNLAPRNSNALGKARPTVTSADPSNARSPDSSTGESRQQPGLPLRRKDLDKT